MPSVSVLVEKHRLILGVKAGNPLQCSSCSTVCEPTRPMHVVLCQWYVLVGHIDVAVVQHPQTSTLSMEHVAIPQSMFDCHDL